MSQLNNELQEFYDSKIMWFINNTLHLFGWALVAELDNNKKVINIYPKKVVFRGFNTDDNTDGYIKVSEYLTENIERLTIEARN